MDSISTDYWRDYFGTAKSDIFQVIEHSILVAAADYPKEFRLKKGQIAEILFSGPTQCSCYDHREMKDSNSIESKYKGVDDQGSIDADEGQNHALEEILRIKQILDNFADETGPVLLESLKRLQLMTLITLSTLEESGIGISVRKLRKHESMDVRNLARRLIDSWRGMVDEWLTARQASLPTAAAVDDDDDDDDDDDSTPDSNICNRIPKAAPDRENTSDEKKLEISQVKNEGVIVKPIMQRVDNEVKSSQQRPELVLIQNASQCKSDCVDEVKLEAAKRKLQQNYKQIENAKRQRTIQVIEMKDLPKQGHAQKKGTGVKYPLQSKNRMNGRR